MDAESSNTGKIPNFLSNRGPILGLILSLAFLAVASTPALSSDHARLPTERTSSLSLYVPTYQYCPPRSLSGTRGSKPHTGRHLITLLFHISLHILKKLHIINYINNFPRNRLHKPGRMSWVPERTHHLLILIVLFTITPLAAAGNDTPSTPDLPLTYMLTSAFGTYSLLHVKKAVNTIWQAWTRYRTHTDSFFTHTKSPIQNIHPPQTPLTLTLLNIRGKYDDIAHRLAIRDHLLRHNADFIGLIDTNHHRPNSLQWDIQYLDPDAEYSHDPPPHTALQHIDTTYTIHGTTPPPSPQQQGRGLILYIHKKWKRRMIGEPEQCPLERWLHAKFHSPNGILHIILFYGRTPHDGPQAQPERDVLQSKIDAAHAKDHSVIILTDMNLSLNDSAHRLQDTPNDQSRKRQHTILTNFLQQTRLIDTTHPPSHSPYTRKSGKLYSSPDHILTSPHLKPYISHTTVDHDPIIHNLTDHASLTLHLQYHQVNPNLFPARPKIAFPTTPDDLAHLRQHLHEDLNQTNPNCISTTLKTIYNTTHRLFGKKPHHPKQPIQKHTLLKDIKLLRKCRRLLTLGLPLPRRLATHPRLKDRTLQTDSDIHDTIKHTYKAVRKFGQRQKRIRFANLRKLKSNLFKSGRFGRFLRSALNRGTDFKGIQGFLLHNIIITEPARVIKTATTRIRDTFYSNRLPTVHPYFATYDDHHWDSLPSWFQSIFSVGRRPQQTTRFASVYSPISLSLLQTTLQHRPNKKAPGPSGVTYDMLKALSPQDLETYILPILNTILRTHHTPTILKCFQVWPTEKEPNSGSIITVAGKINVRPISLYETLAKLLETIITYRLHHIMDKHNTLHHSQNGFRLHKSVEDTLLMYTFLFEDAHQHKKELHISANDCSQAYDAIPHWAMRLIYRQHGFDETLINILTNLDKGRPGQILTAYGSGPTFNSQCGLGQGSSIAPLKWNLFLNTLLEWQKTQPQTPTSSTTGMSPTLSVP